MIRPATGHDKSHMFKNGTARSQPEVLEDNPDAAIQERNLAIGKFGDIHAVDTDDPSPSATSARYRSLSKVVLPAPPGPIKNRNPP